jgi:DNA repair protein NreA
LVIREIHPEYVIPVGVWQIREGIREALKEKEKGKGKEKKQQFDNFEQAMSFACANLSISKKEVIRNSKIYKNIREQARITEYFFKKDIG